MREGKKHKQLGKVVLSSGFCALAGDLGAQLAMTEASLSHAAHVGTYMFVRLHSYLLAYRVTDRHAGRQADRQTDPQTNTRTDRQMYEHTYSNARNR